MNPLISAIVVTRNRIDLLPKAIESIRAQTYKPVEIIVVDDASSDGTSEYLSRLKDEGKIKYIKLSKSSGACHARNVGIEAASGEYVAGLDDDDEWHPMRLDVLMRHIDNAYSFVCASDRVWRPDGTSLVNKRCGPVGVRDMLFSNRIGNQVLALRERIVEVRGFDVKLVAAQDYDLWMRLIIKFGPALAVPEILQNIYENHGATRISNKKNKISGYFFFYRRYRHLMNREQRASQLRLIYRIKGKRCRFATASALSNGEMMSAIKNYLIFNFPSSVRLGANMRSRVITSLWRIGGRRD